MRREPFNLIVTHYPGYDNYVVAREKLKKVLDNARIVDTSQSIILLIVDDPYAAIEKIKSSEEMSSSPILRVIPVDAVTDVFVDRIREVVHEIFRRKASPNDTFKIKIDGRVYKREEGEVARIHRNEAIELIAHGIDNPVDLDYPDWLIYIKTLRLYRATELSSITICRRDQILSFAPKEEEVEKSEEL
ncbi:MAG: THUMP domain-containing protein [Fervidicoccaceae archaeon]